MAQLQRFESGFGLQRNIQRKALFRAVARAQMAFQLDSNPANEESLASLRDQVRLGADQTNGFGFGAPQPSQGLGQPPQGLGQPQQGLGQPQPFGQSLFSAPQQQTGGLFTPQRISTFDLNQQNAPKPQSTQLFGQEGQQVLNKFGLRR